MTEPELVTAIRDTLDEVLADRLPIPTLLEAAVGKPDFAPLRAELSRLGLGGLAVPERLGGIGAGEVVIAELFGVAGRRLLPHALRQEVMVLAPALAALADTGSRWAAGALARYLAGELVGAGAAARPDQSVSLDELAGGRRRLRLRTWVAEPPELVAVVCAGWVALLPGDELTITGSGIDRGHQWGTLTLTHDSLARGLVDELDARPIVDHWQLALFAELHGVADAALHRSLTYATQRHQFGRPISDQQAVAHRLADMTVRVESGAAAVSRHVATLAIGDRDQLADEQRVLQYWAPASARQVCEDAIQVHGGTGFTWEYGLHLGYRRALALQALFGGADRAARRAATALLAGRAAGADEPRGES